MKKPLMGMMLMLAMAWAVGALEVGDVNGAAKEKPSAVVASGESSAGDICSRSLRE